MGHPVLNIISGRYISNDKRAYNDLIRRGYTHDRQHNILVLRQITHPPLPVGTGGAVMSNISLMNEDISDIGVEPLNPTVNQTFKSEIVKNVEKISDWFWKHSALLNVSSVAATADVSSIRKCVRGSFRRNQNSTTMEALPRPS